MCLFVANLTGDNCKLFTLYRNASGNECPLSLTLPCRRAATRVSAAGLAPSPAKTNQWKA